MPEEKAHRLRTLRARLDAPRRRVRYPAMAARLVALAMAALVMVEAVWLTRSVIGPDPTWDLGMDFRYYVSLGTRWLATGTFYEPHQLAGPYPVTLLGQGPTPDTLYPPSALFLFVPFTYLPAVLWWVVPIGVSAAAIWRLRPSPLALAMMLALLAWPRAIGAYLFGNTDIWMMAGIAAGLVWGWPALAVTLKPTLAPLALVGVRHRSWWLGLVALVVSAVLMVDLWIEYAVAISNAQGLSLNYSLGSLPLVSVPLVAWLASDETRTITK